MKPQLAVIRGLVCDIEDNGRIVEIIEFIPSGAEWVAPDGDWFRGEDGDAYGVVSCGRQFEILYEDGVKGLSMYAQFFVKNVFPIRDLPGNEQFVTEARNKLKGRTEITERGILQGETNV